MLVVGPRRAGKTTLLRGTYPSLPYFTLDDFDLLRLARSDPKKLVSMLGPVGILDEVQRVPELLVAVKFGIDEMGQTVLMTGSSTLGLASKDAETLAGRIAHLECPTFCWGEEIGQPTHRCLEMPSDPLQVFEANRSLETALAFGGFPEVALAGDTRDKREILRNYKNTYFTKDLLLLSNIENADALMALMAYMSIATGSHIDVSNAARESGLSHPTAKKYINVLLASRLAFKLYGFQYGPAKRFTRAAKYYFSDVGILEALGVTVSQGQRLESFVVSEMEKRRKLGRFSCDRLHYYKSAAGAEIDLVIDEPHQTTAVEIKHTRAPGPRDVRHLRSFVRQKSDKPRRAFLIYLGERVLDLGDVTALPVGHLWRSF
jgi:predicted AAA+ superfamily ATPase